MSLLRAITKPFPPRWQNPICRFYGYAPRILLVVILYHWQGYELTGLMILTMIYYQMKVRR